MQKALRGLSTLLFVLTVGVSLYGQFRLVPLDTPGDWSLLALRLTAGGLYALALSAVLFWAAEWRLSLLRRRDIVFGDGAE